LKAALTVLAKARLRSELVATLDVDKVEVEPPET
jgi:hypothetical protein